MKVTVILRDKTEQFYTGFGESIIGLLNMTDAEKFAYLNKRRNDHGFSMKIGTGQFRDSVDLNQMLRRPVSYAFKLEPRRGYRLAIFEIAPA